MRRRAGICFACAALVLSGCGSTAEDENIRFGTGMAAGAASGAYAPQLAGVSIADVAEFESVVEGIREGEAVSLRVLDQEFGETVINFRAAR